MGIAIAATGWRAFDAGTTIVCLASKCGIHTLPLPYFYYFRPIGHNQSIYSNMKKMISIMVAVCMVGTMMSCHHKHEHEHEHNHAEAHEHEHEHNHDHGHHHDHGHSHSHGANVVAFSSEQGEKVGLTLEKVSPSTFGQVIKTSAQVLPSQGDEREATASASGVVSFTNPNLVEGAAVKAGQQLFTIESNSMADNNMSVRYQEAAANYNAAKMSYERKQRLAEDKIVSQTDLEQARATYEAAKAVYDNLKGNFSKNGAVVRAPISGYVQRIHVSNGGYVEAGQSVVTVTQNRDLQLRAEVQPRYYNCLKNIRGVNIRIPGDSKTYTSDELGGTLVSYGKATDADCPLVPITFRIRNVGQLLSGSFVTAYIITQSDREVLSVPNEAIVEEMGNFFLFVKVHEGEYEKRLVTLGATDGIRTEVTTGLQAGEVVVAKGASMVRLAQNSSALDPHAGHVH